MSIKDLTQQEICEIFEKGNLKFDPLYIEYLTTFTDYIKITKNNNILLTTDVDKLLCFNAFREIYKKEKVAYTLEQPTNPFNYDNLVITINSGYICKKFLFDYYFENCPKNSLHELMVACSGFITTIMICDGPTYTEKHIEDIREYFESYEDINGIDNYSNDDNDCCENNNYENNSGFYQDNESDDESDDKYDFRKVFRNNGSDDEY